MTSTTPPPAEPPPLKRWQQILSASQFFIALAITLGVLGYLLRTPAAKHDSTEDRGTTSSDPVQLAGPGLIRVDPASPLTAKFKIAEVQPVRVTAPILTVTGTVVASLRPGHGKPGDAILESIVGTALITGRANDYWQFSSAEVLGNFTDWQKATADISFTRTQLAAVRALADARLTAQLAVVARLVKYVEAGTDAKKDLDIARADLIQVEINGQKDIHEAENALKVALKTETATSLQLQQTGLDPGLLTSVTSDVDIVMADVPEGMLGRVKSGQGCDARFFGVPDDLFTGRVRSIAPVLSKDRRSLRVLFTIDDLRDQLRPGMFAEIGLGTDAREALLAPADGSIHTGRNDYMLVATNEPGVWRVTLVEIGELREGRIEVLKGLKPGDRVLGQGAILLKPAVVRSLLGGGP